MATTSGHPSATRFHGLWWAGWLGVLASFALLISSVGSSDVRTWERFAHHVGEIGLIELYRSDSTFNHPPLMGYLAWLCWRVSGFLGVPFPMVFKLLPVLANIGTAILLMKLWQGRGEAHLGYRAFAQYCWSVCAILVGAFHGNTDSIVVFACVGCLYLLEEERPGLAGLSLAAAINVKIIPVLLFLPLLATQRTKRAASAFTAGTACSALPFVLAWTAAGDALIRNIFAYESNLEPWGIQAILLALQALLPVGPDEATSLAGIYYETLGRPVVIVAVLLVAAYGYRQELSPARLMAATFCVFLIVTPAFGVQYTVYLVPTLLAVSLTWALRYDLVAGLFILLVYLHFRRGDWFPLYSWHTTDIPAALAPLGLVAWMVAVGCLSVCLRGPRQEGGATIDTISTPP